MFDFRKFLAAVTFGLFTASSVPTAKADLVMLPNVQEIAIKMANQPQMDWLFCAATAAGEARSEGERGMQGVLNVVMNRKKSPITWWKSEEGDGIPDGTLAAVCLDNKQFSCWNKFDPNYDLCRVLADPDKIGENLERPYFRQALYLSLMMVEGRLEDITKGSLHYHTRAIKPKWARNRSPVIALGSHFFYNDVT